MKKAVSIGLAVTVLFVLTASAPASHTSGRRAPGSIRPKARTIDAGEKVTFRGRLKSDWMKCFANRRVTLFKEDQPILSKLTTRRALQLLAAPEHAHMARGVRRQEVRHPSPRAPVPVEFFSELRDHGHVADRAR